MNQMRIIAELAVKSQLEPVLNILKTDWKIELDDRVFMWLEDIKMANFRIYEDTLNGVKRRVILPVPPNMVFVYSYGKHAEDTIGFAGATMVDGKPATEGDIASIIVFGNETEQVLELRLVHEILHAMQLPADDLLKYVSKILSLWELCYFIFQQYMKKAPEHNPGYQTKYYHWLLSQRNNGLM